MLRAKSKVCGSVLIEFMIALTLSALSLYSLLSFHTSLFVSEYQNQQLHQVNDAAEKVLTIMQRELKRAGFMQKLLANDPNPFINSSGGLFQTNVAMNCITYRYDRNKNGLLDNEYYGFRLHNNAIQVSKGNAQNCSYTSGWESLSDKNTVTISNLKFTLEAVTGGALSHAQTYIVIDMDIANKLARDLQLNFKRNVLTQAVL